MRIKDKHLRSIDTVEVRPGYVRSVSLRYRSAGQPSSQTALTFRRELLPPREVASGLAGVNDINSN